MVSANHASRNQSQQYSGRNVAIHVTIETILNKLSYESVIIFIAEFIQNCLNSNMDRDVSTAILLGLVSRSMVSANH